MIFDPSPGRELSITSLDDTQIWQEITRVARAALREADLGDVSTVPVARLRAAIPTGETWDVRAQPLLQANDERPVVVVAIERILSSQSGASGPADPVDELRDRFGLSPRQAEVARFLAQRLTDKEIASRLGISRHTARRHVELTMIRLRVHSRAEVGELLAGAA